jgi:hypothetical protein
MTRVRNAFLASLMFVSSVAAIDFSEALKEADRNSQTSAGKDYDIEFGRSFGSRHVDLMGLCTRDVPAEEREPFYIVASVAMSGVLEEVLVSPENHVSRCVKDRMATLGYPNPPKSHYWVSVHMRMK